jgi:phosphoserine phosphatase RsbU/P
MAKQTTIFRQLIFNVVFPAFMALILLGALNYANIRKILIDGIESQNKIISDEILNVLEFQDVALSILEIELNKRMEQKSSELVNNYLRNTQNISAVDLFALRQKMGLDSTMEDIYIIGRDGIIINTTFAKDYKRNLFDYGKEHQQYLLRVFQNGRFFPERFGIEGSTRRLKKYTYQPTLDGKYIIELGAYSSKADEIITFIKNRLSTLAEKKQGIVSVDLFIGADKTFSLNQDAAVMPEHSKIVKDLFYSKSSKTILAKEHGTIIQYDYKYMNRKNSDLYRGMVMRIITDRGFERQILRNEMFKFFIIFLLTVTAVIILIYRKTRVITDPIKKLAYNVMRITDGHLNERAEVLGNNEIATLSEKFNIMIEQLESYYYELEEKVRERTSQIQHQKEEIEAQRDSIEYQKNILAEINANLQNAYVEIEEQKKNITDSIYYARRIQNAILPPDEHVKKTLHDSFVLYMPKDIVSGDFYWVNQHKDLVVFAAVDCTGHGVPGAFMSIVGSNQLNYAVNIQGITRPSDILNAVNQGVTNTLRQSRGSVVVKDGMDIALCVADFTNRKLEFAGAFNPLFIVRNGELIHIKGNKFPIGAFIGDQLNQFENHQVDLEPGDVIYIFSDGYVDQFGGEENKKFLIKRFRDLLIEIAPEPMDRQKELLFEAHLKWKGDSEQVDDILVIGVKLT